MSWSPFLPLPLHKRGNRFQPPWRCGLQVTTAWGKNQVKAPTVESIYPSERSRSANRSVPGLKGKGGSLTPARGCCELAMFLQNTFSPNNAHFLHCFHGITQTFFGFPALSRVYHVQLMTYSYMCSRKWRKGNLVGMVKQILFPSRLTCSNESKRACLKSEFL